MILSLLISLAACVWFIFELWSARRGWATLNWPSVPGVILIAALSTSRAFGSGGPFVMTVRYSYEVDGKPFEGTRLQYGHDSFDSTYLEAAAKKRLAGYEPGKATRVHFNPRNPNDAVLEPGVKPHTYLYLLLSAAFLAAGIQGIFLALRG
jgi:hypothetical protein